MGSVIALPEKDNFTREFCAKKVLDDFDKERAEKRPKKRARGTFLHLDNAPAHRAGDDFDRLGITRLPHPCYSPDLAPCGFEPFGKLKRKLEEKAFTKAIQLLAKANAIFMDSPLLEFLSVFGDCNRRLVECIDAAGDYL
jgi:hypothetical protein